MMRVDKLSTPTEKTRWWTREGAKRNIRQYG